jgi:hypothetical protein
MQWFEVRQVHEDLWSVSSKGRTLYLYSSEDEARQAALMLASEGCHSGTKRVSSSSRLNDTTPWVLKDSGGSLGCRREQA